MIEENGGKPLTPRQIASQKNGAKSKGPKTEEGKKRVSLNALKHGLCASSGTVLKGENREAFEALRRSFYQEFDPQSPSEIYLVEKVVSCAWRTKRIYTMEMDTFDNGKRPHRQFEGEHVPVMVLTRYEAALDRTFNQTIKQLREIKAKRPKGTDSADIWEELLDAPDIEPEKPVSLRDLKWSDLSPEQQARMKPYMTDEDRKRLGIE